MDLNRLIEGIHEYIGKSLQPLAVRLKALEDIPPPAAGPQGAPGENGADGLPGQDGASVAAEDVLPALKEQVAEFLATVELPKDGEKGADGASITLEDVMPVLTEQVAKHLETVKAPDPDEIAQNLQLRFKGQFAEFLQRADETLKSLPVPKDGVAGQDGRDAPTIEEILTAHEARLKGMFSEWALSFEREANARVERFLEAIPKPKDGRDALQVEDFDLTVSEDGRVATVSLKAGDRLVEKTIRLATLVDKGIFKQDADYEKGDGVTWGGSYWVATKDLPTGNPGEPGSEGWRLCVKRGRDGKNGRDGIDMTAPVKLK